MTARKTKAFQHGNKAMISVLLDNDQVESLEDLAVVRRVSRAALIREAIDLYLRKREGTEAVDAA